MNVFVSIVEQARKSYQLFFSLRRKRKAIVVSIPLRKPANSRPPNVHPATQNISFLFITIRQEVLLRMMAPKGVLSLFAFKMAGQKVASYDANLYSSCSSHGDCAISKRS